MPNRQPLELAWEPRLDVKLVPAVARLSGAVRGERRNPIARQALVSRVYAEFREMPGLSLTLAQAARLFGLRPDIASRILHTLADERLLFRSRDDRFGLRAES
jgi:hypothetical protein